MPGPAGVSLTYLLLKGLFTQLFLMQNPRPIFLKKRTVFYSFQMEIFVSVQTIWNFLSQIGSLR